MMTQNDFYWAMALGDLDRVRAGLESGKTIDVRTSDGMEALFFAVEIGNGAVLRILLNAGAPVDARDVQGRTLVHAAARWNRVGMLEELLLLNLDLNARAEDPRACAPIHEAAQNGALDAVRWLLAKGADANVRLQTGQTPADLAEGRGHHEIVRVLGGRLTVGEHLLQLAPLSSVWFP